jgi:hypothetical protein
LRLREDGASRPSARACSTAWLRRRFQAETAEHGTPVRVIWPDGTQRHRQPGSIRRPW